MRRESLTATYEVNNLARTLGGPGDNEFLPASIQRGSAELIVDEALHLGDSPIERVWFATKVHYSSAGTGGDESPGCKVPWSVSFCDFDRGVPNAFGDTNRTERTANRENMLNSNVL